MRMLLYVVAFAGIGLLVGLGSRRYRPAAAPPSAWISTLPGVIDSLVAGLLTLTMLGYWRRHVHEIGHDRAYSNSDDPALPAYWLSLMIAPLGAVLVLIVTRLIRARNENLDLVSRLVQPGRVIKETW